SSFGLLFTGWAFAQSASQIEFFEKKIRPVLATNCAACHNAKATTAGLDLSTTEGIRYAVQYAGEAAKLISLDKPEESLLPPAVKDAAWIRSPLDRFMLAKLEEKKLKPSPAADKATLLRRVTFDLTGLPPTETEIKDFLADNSAKAYEKVVDRLLASPRYGE